jgi:hypothetical protein
MAKTYEPIATTTLGSAAASYTFSSIPSTYTDLVLVAVTKNSVVTVNGIFIRYNGDTASNYSTTFLYGNGTSAVSSRASSQTQAQIGWDGSTDFVPTIINIQNYSNATTYKTALSRSNEPSSRVAAWVSLWRSTAAVTSITLTAESPANFAIGSTFTLYGIKAA